MREVRFSFVGKSLNSIHVAPLPSPIYFPRTRISAVGGCAPRTRNRVIRKILQFSAVVLHLVAEFSAFPNTIPRSVAT